MSQLEVPHAGGTSTIALVDLPEDESFDDLAEHLHHEHRAILDGVDALIVRPPADHNGLPPLRSLKASRLRLRIPPIPVHVLYSHDYAIDLTRDVNDAHSRFLRLHSRKQRSTFIHALRQQELRAIAIETQAILPRHDGYWYQLPSGVFSQMFIRVGNVQSNRHVVDIFFFWLLPYLKDVEAILTDTWSISSIAFNTSRLLLRYNPTGHVRCQVNMASRYVDESDHAGREISRVLRRFRTPDGKKILVLGSARMTGRFEEVMRRIIEKYGHDPDRFRFVTMYKLCEGKYENMLCDLSEGFGEYNFSFVSEPPCQDYRPTVIAIDPQTYFPARFEEVLIGVRTDVADRSKEFFDRYRGRGVISVHRDAYENYGVLKHRAIFIDVLRMLDVPEFRARLAAAVGELEPPPKMVIAPPHEAGDALRAAAVGTLRERTGLAVPSYRHSSLFLQPDAFAVDREIAAAVSQLTERDSILIADDTCQSGDRLRRYQANLREHFQCRIHYLVGVARPKSESAWVKLKQMLAFRRPGPRHSVQCLEFVVLPYWVDSEDLPCPWCDELQFLSNRRDELGDGRCPSAIEKRIEFLKSSHRRGLTDEIFYRLPTDYELKLGNQSIFVSAPCSQADVFAAVAAALQWLRTLPGGQALTPHRHPIAPVLHSEEYLRAVFTDSVLRASFLRAAKRHELVHLDERRERERGLSARKILTDDDPNWANLTIEILYHGARRKLPLESLTAEEEAALGRRGQLEVARFFGFCNS